MPESFVSSSLDPIPQTSLAPGYVTLVGAGPGAPELLTLRGWRALGDADVVVHDRLIGLGVLDYARPDAELIDVGKRGGCHPVPQEEIEKILVERAWAGKRVVRLKGGDPFLFGRGGEEVAALARAGVPWEVVPGVTSAIAVPACVGIPVTHRGLSSSLHVIAAHRQEGAEVDYEALARLGGTLVFLMGASRLREICQRLTAAGMDGGTPAAIVENGATPGQRRVVGVLADLPERAEAESVGAPAVIIVGGVVALAEALGRRQAWSKAAAPLGGRRVLAPYVARKGGGGRRLAALLRQRGAEVAEIPVSRTEGVEVPLPPLGGYSWLVFTSAAGVEAFFARLWVARGDVREVGGAKVAAVGPATAAALESRGLRVDLVPNACGGAALGEALRSISPDAGGRVLLLRAERGAEGLAEVLSGGGVRFDQVSLYRTVPIPFRVRAEAFDAVAFTCASSVRALSGACPGQRVKAACIGELTAKAASEAGYEVQMARQVTLEALAEAVENLLRRK